MNGIHTETVSTHPAEEPQTRAISGGSMLETFGAVATIALAIVGLAGMSRLTLAAIATIVAGAATLMEGGTLAMRRESGAWTEALSEGSQSAAFQGGIAAVVLGILALLGVAPTSLISIAVLVLGGTFALTGRSIIGLGAIVLGILAVCGISSPVLFLVGLLILGAGLLMGGSRRAASTLTTATTK